MVIQVPSSVIGRGVTRGGMSVLLATSTAAKYSSVPAAQRGPAVFAHTQRASTTLSEANAITLQAGVSNTSGLEALPRSTRHVARSPERLGLSSERLAYRFAQR
jgi:hypothetical protein